MSKVTQIEFVGPSPVAATESEGWVYVVMDDGKVWRRYRTGGEWQEFGPIPGSEADARKESK